MAEHHLTEHGHTRRGNISPTYKSWMAMRRRCGYIKGAKPDYAGRGITVCDQWVTSFANFLADMGERPPGMTLDRFPNRRGNYEPGNVRWATAKTQSNNHSNVRLVAAFGRTQSIQAWADEFGISSNGLVNRLKRLPAEEALTEPVKKVVLTVEAFGVSRTVKEWSAVTGIKTGTIHYRLSHGWSSDLALTP